MNFFCFYNKKNWQGLAAGGLGNRQLENIQYFNGEYAIFYKSLKACSFSKIFQDTKIFTKMKDSEKSSVRVHFNF